MVEYNEESNAEKENLIQEESQESDTVLQQKYVDDDKVKCEFDQLFEKHKKMYNLRITFQIFQKTKFQLLKTIESKFKLNHFE